MMIFHQYVTWGPPHTTAIHQEASGLQRPGRRVLLYHGRDVVEQLVKKSDADVGPHDIWHTWQFAPAAMGQIPFNMYGSF